MISVPAEHLEPMKAMPMWPLMEAGAATLVYDAAVMDGCQDGTGLAAEVVDDLRAITVLVLDGGASASTMRTGADAIAVRLSNGRRCTLDGQTHEADPVTLSAALIAHFAA